MINIDIVTTLLAGIVSMFAGAITFLLSSDVIKEKTYRLLGLRKNKQESLSERIIRLNKSLKISSNEIESVLREMEEITKNKEKNIIIVEEKIEKLNAKENEMQTKINMMANNPLIKIDKIEKILEEGEKRSKKRDLVLFALGVIVSTVLSIFQKIIFNN
jgi:uncharacterized Zn finger protein